jgi:hypothetical protein
LSGEKIMIRLLCSSFDFGLEQKSNYSTDQILQETNLGFRLTDK